VGKLHSKMYGKLLHMQQPMCQATVFHEHPVFGHPYFGILQANLPPQMDVYLIIPLLVGCSMVQYYFPVSELHV
jgi:hypothetical protein